MDKKFYVIGATLVFLLIVAGYFLLRDFNMGHSSLLKDKEMNSCCKMYLECAYYMQKTDKSGCADFSSCCRKDIVSKECTRKYEIFSKDWDICLRTMQ